VKFRVFSVSLIAAALIGQTAFAGDTNVTSGATSSASTQSASNSANSQSSSITQNSYGQKDQVVSTVPTVFAPGLVGSLNGCLGSASGGVSVLGAGVTLGSTRTDEACERRAYAEFVLTQLHDKDTAIQLICQDKIVRLAYAKTNPHLCIK
jgi:hypothetical protein